MEKRQHFQHTLSS